MADPQTDIEALESRFPADAASAFAEARKRVLASGQSILEAEHGVIYENFPDGRHIERKKIEPPIRVVPGSKIRIGSGS